MNKVKAIFEGSSDIKEFSKSYFNYIHQLLSDLDVTAIAAFAEEMEKARITGNTVFIVGNGGSAVTASHMANDFGGDILKKTKCGLPFCTLALTDNTALMLAIANDDGYENLFVNQLRIHYRPGDKLVAISASGNSPNVVAAAEWVKERKGAVISLVGFDGGKLKEVSDVVIHVKTNKGEYGPVEDIHMIMNHLVANWLQYQVGANPEQK